MKPKEFDELIRQKFDQGDFEYSPRNWERLTDELDGRAKKRSAMMWWLMPLAGIAASVALAMGVPGLYRHIAADNAVATTEMVQERTYASIQSAPVQDNTPAADAQPAADGNTGIQHRHITKNNKHIQAVAALNDNTGRTGLTIHENTMHPADAHNGLPANRVVNLLAVGNIPSQTKSREQKKAIAVADGYNTFKPEAEVREEKKAAKLSIILSGGLNRGNQNNGYMAGATIRRMLNDKVYVEGDVAIANSNNSQMLPVTKNVPAFQQGGGYGKVGAAKASSPDASKASVAVSPEGIVTEENVSYNISYAQVTPSIGYKLTRKMSLAAGPDFQQMLSDNRPVASDKYRGTAQESAMFDVGLMGKTEYSLTRNVKAAVSYRKGVSSILTPTEKYIDRDYLQFQVRCAIFNK